MGVIELENGKYGLESRSGGLRTCDLCSSSGPLHLRMHLELLHPRRVPWASISELDELCTWIFSDAADDTSKRGALSKVRHGTDRNFGMSILRIA